MARTSKPRTVDLAAIDAAVRAFALQLPGAWTDIPWESDLVSKVGKKIFAFHGNAELRPHEASLGVKLTQEHDHALSYDFASPTRYGLGKSGWVTCQFTPATPPPELDLLLEWVEESYRNVALKRFIKELDAR
jgi:predicted DNA-binding protein (MmcQ/YjbR family)